MKKELPAGAIVGAIVALVAIVGLAVFFFVKKTDPAMQAPNPAPRFDPVAKQTESKGHGGISFERGPPSAGGAPEKPHMSAQQ